MLCYVIAKAAEILTLEKEQKRQTQKLLIQLLLSGKGADVSERPTSSSQPLTRMQHFFTQLRP